MFRYVMKYKYSQLTRRISYKECKNKYDEFENKVEHWGQLKLLLSEILFLTMFRDQSYTVLYIGAAPGIHIPLLVDLFPQHKYELWDPGSFCETLASQGGLSCPREHSSPHRSDEEIQRISPGVFKLSKRDNIVLNRRFFDEKQAKRYENRDNVLIICDIRNLAIANARSEKNIQKADSYVIADMKKQMKWVQQIKPVAAYLKFRLGYMPGNLTYFNGPIVMQPYAPTNSTEARIIVKNVNKTKNYNNNEYEEKMAYFNCHIRTKKYKKWNNIITKIGIKNNWDNTFMLTILNYYMNKVKGVRDDDLLIEFYYQIIDWFNNPK